VESERFRSKTEHLVPALVDGCTLAALQSTPDHPDAVHPPRPQLDERREYLPRARQEEFIVPLLRSAVEGAIEAAAANRTRNAQPHTPPRALDVGCGGQPFRAQIERLNFTYFSADTQAQPGTTLDAVWAVDEPVPAALADLSNSNAHTGFDLILCTEVLEHVLDWPAAWANLHRLLAPGGRLIITCPHVYPLHEEPYDFWRPTPYALRRFADRFGFVVIEQRQLGDGFDVLGTINAACTPDPASRGPVACLIAAAARKCRKLHHRALRSRTLRTLLTPRSKLYLSNFIVLTKPDDAA